MVGAVDAEAKQVSLTGLRFPNHRQTFHIQDQTNSKRTRPVQNRALAQADFKGLDLGIGAACHNNEGHQPFLSLEVSGARKSVDLCDQRIIVKNQIHPVFRDKNEPGCDGQGQIQQMGLRHNIAGTVGSNAGGQLKIPQLNLAETSHVLLRC